MVFLLLTALCNFASFLHFLLNGCQFCCCLEQATTKPTEREASGNPTQARQGTTQIGWVHTPLCHKGLAAFRQKQYSIDVSGVNARAQVGVGSQPSFVARTASIPVKQCVVHIYIYAYMYTYIYTHSERVRGGRKHHATQREEVDYNCRFFYAFY